MSFPDSRPLQPRSSGLCRVPFTLSFLAAMLIANGLAGTFSGQIDAHVLAARGISVEGLRNGEALRFLSATFLSHDLPMLLRQVAFAAGVIGLAEWLWGSWRTAGLFFGIDIMSSLILLAAVALIPGLDGLAGVTDVGMSLGGFGLIGVLVGARRYAAVGLAAILVLLAAKYAAAPEPFADAGHVIALILGFGISRLRAPAFGPAADMSPHARAGSAPGNGQVAAQRHAGHLPEQGDRAR